MRKITAETVRVEMLITDACGVYIPKNFGKIFTDGAICDRDGNENVELTELVNSFADREPDEEGYWEDWETVLNTVYVYAETHNGADCEVYSLYQNGDLRAINESDLKQLDEEETEKFWDNLSF